MSANTIQIAEQIYQSKTLHAQFLISFCWSRVGILYLRNREPAVLQRNLGAQMELP